MGIWTQQNPLTVRELLVKKSRLHEQSGCLEWIAGRNPQGYGGLEYHGKWWQAHRLAWSALKGEIPAGLCVLHRCDNPRCVNVDHLFLGTHLDNVKDCMAKGRRALLVGEQRPSSKLSASEVKIIRARHRRFDHANSMQKIADDYGLALCTIVRIIRRITRKHV